MKKLLCAFLALGLAMPSVAQEAADSDSDGRFSLQELAAAFPGLTATTYVLIDADGDGSVDRDELAAAEAAGLVGN